jgi:hypothetical protein
MLLLLIDVCGGARDVCGGVKTQCTPLRSTMPQLAVEKRC